MEKTEFYSLLNYDEYPLREMEKRSEEFYLEMKKSEQFANFQTDRYLVLL